MRQHLQTFETESSEVLDPRTDPRTAFVVSKYPWVIEENAPLLKAPLTVHQKVKKYKWVIMATVNNAFLDFFLNWLSSFENLKNLRNVPIYVVAEDAEVVPKLQSIPRIHVVTTDLNLNNLKDMKTERKTKHTLVSKRPGQIQQVWNLSKTESALLFIDIDMVWLGDPFPDIEESLVGYEMTTQVDRTKELNTGFVAFPKTDRNYDFLKVWRDEIEEDGKRSQPAYNKLIKQHNRTVSMLPIMTFPWGMLYFQDNQRNSAKIAHANGVEMWQNGTRGHDPKVDVFKNIGLWYIAPQYQSLLQ